jgi:hypothetical protein
MSSVKQGNDFMFGHSCVCQLAHLPTCLLVMSQSVCVYVCMYG